MSRLHLCVSLLVACASSAEPERAASSAEPPASAAASAEAPSASASAVASAEASAIRPVASTIAYKFSGALPADLKPVAIYRGPHQSGLVVLLPPAFNMDFWGFNVGLRALSSPSPGVVFASLAVEVTVAAEPLQPGAPKATARCNGVWFKNGKWTTSERIDIPGAEALVWFGVDAGEAGRTARNAYLLEGTFGSDRVVACGTWDAAHPELETAVATALRSIRRGKAPRGNYEN